VTIDAPTATRPVRSGAAVTVVLHAIVAGALLWWSWRKWPDPLVDFGRELYLPWQITQGRVLYRDLASLFGPLSPYLNALWFSLFGVSLNTLVACNVAILLAMVAGIHRLLAVSTDRLTATLATLTILFVCGFNQYIDVGNYNFVTPYAHEATHGMALSVGVFVTVYEGIARRRHAWFFASGLGFGALTLTKPEVAIAAGAALAVGVWAAWMDAPAHRFRLAAATFLAGAVIVPLAFLIWFHTGGHMTWRGAANALASGWAAASSSEVAQNEFYLRGSGLDDLAHNAGRMLWSFALFSGVVVAGLILGRVKPSRPIPRVLQAAGQLAILLIATRALSSGRLGWALPLIALTVCVWTIFGVVTGKRSGTLSTQVPLTMWSVFAVALLPKIALNARIYHYGFFLAMPALTVVVALIAGLLPVAVMADPVSRQRTRTLFAVSVALAIVPALALSNRWYRGKTVVVGRGGDRFYASGEQAMWQGPSVETTLEWLEQNAPRGATLVALPEGVMINYLSRRDNPTPFVNFMPPEALAFGEHAMARALDAQPPDFLLLVHKNTGEYGYASFGSTPEYGGEILPWVRRNYRTVETIGRNPADAHGYGIEILRRARVRPD
jgi:hypothetical protein